MQTEKQNKGTAEHQKRSECLSPSLNKAAGPMGRGGSVVAAAGVAGQGN